MTTFTWDNRNRLSRATLKNSSGVTQQVVDYTYDAFNQLIGEKVTPYSGGEAGTPTVKRFAYDPLTGEMQLAFNGSGNLTDRHLWGPLVDQVLADEEVESLTSAGTVEWILNDGKGGPTDVWFDGSASLSDHVQYNAWGGIASQTDSANAPLFGYNGAYTDPATGMQWHLNRWYLPWAERWASADPIFPLSGSNPFAYCNNSPTNGIDPTGLFDFLGKTYVMPWQEGASLNPFNSVFVMPGRQVAGEADSIALTLHTVPIDNANDIADAGTGSLGNSVASVPKGLASAYQDLRGNHVAANRLACEAYKQGPLGQTKNAPAPIKWGTRGALAVATAATAAAVALDAAGAYVAESLSPLETEAVDLADELLAQREIWGQHEVLYNAAVAMQDGAADVWAALQENVATAIETNEGVLDNLLDAIIPPP